MPEREKSYIDIHTMMNEEERERVLAASSSSSKPIDDGRRSIETELARRLVSRSALANVGMGASLHPLLADHGSSTLQHNASYGTLTDEVARLEAQQIADLRNTMAIQYALRASALLNPPAATSLQSHFSSSSPSLHLNQLIQGETALQQSLSLSQRNKTIMHQHSTLSDDDSRPAVDAPAPEAKLCADRKPEPLPSVEDEPAAKKTVTTTSKRPRRRPSKEDYKGLAFPTKLFGMLEQAEDEGYEDIISFLPHGNSFMIYKPEKFAKQVMPKYFKTNRLTSFQKQLSLYGFIRIKGGRDRGAIFHEYFQRDNQKLVAKISRRSQPVASSCVDNTTTPITATASSSSSSSSQARVLEAGDLAFAWQNLLLTQIPGLAKYH